MSRVFLVIILFCCIRSTGFSQVTKTPPPLPPSPIAADTMRLVEILNADKNGYKKIDSVTEYQMLVGNVRMKESSSLFYCDSAIYNKSLHIIEAFGNVHINDADTVNTYAQYLIYYVDTRIAVLKKKVKLTDGHSTLFSEEVQYDMNQKIGEYHNGGKVINGETVLTSKEATYYADLKDVYFKKSVVLKDPKYTLESDSLLYNTDNQMATFIAKTRIEDSAHRKINTTDGFYDLKNKKAYFNKRTSIEDGAVKVTANEIQTDDNTGKNILKGNAVYTDTAQGVSVLANLIEANRKESSFRATLHPLMILKQEKDSIYITADTLYSGKLSLMSKGKDTLLLKDTVKGKLVISMDKDPKEKEDSTDRYFQAYRNVKIFSDSLQAVSDSLFYSGRDSIFKLFQTPIVWANENQVTGDTIYLFTKDKKADKLQVFENGFLVNKSGDNMYNQIKANRLYGYFKEGTIDYMRAKGNAESVYYIKDEDSSLVGINKATGDIIDLRFKEKALNEVVFISEVKGVMYPISQVPETEKILRNFKWLDVRRPKTKFELFGD